MSVPIFTVHISDIIRTHHQDDFDECVDETCRDFLFESGLYETCTQIVCATHGWDIDDHRDDSISLGGFDWAARDHKILDMCWEILNKLLDQYRRY